MGLGNTQLYNIKRIYNHKRHEDIKLGNKVYQFRRKTKFPKKLTQEYLVVDLLNNLDSLAEDKQVIASTLRSRLKHFNTKELYRNATKYGTIAAKKLIQEVI